MSCDCWPAWVLFLPRTLSLELPNLQTFGVGGDEMSWSAEGFRRCKWHGNCRTTYGKAWSTGDVVGCWIDLSSDSSHPYVTIGFSLNGKDLGDAFTCTELDFVKHKAGSLESGGLVRAFDGESSGICPAVSLAKDEQVELNFGQKRFVFSPPERVLKRAQALGQADPPLSAAAVTSLRGYRPIAGLIRSSLMDSGSVLHPNCHRIDFARPRSIDDVFDCLLSLGLPCQWCVRAIEGCRVPDEDMHCSVDEALAWIVQHSDGLCPDRRAFAVVKHILSSASGAPDQCARSMLMPSCSLHVL